MDLFEPRTYRRRMDAEGMSGFRVIVGETDLYVQVSSRDAESVENFVDECRAEASEAAREARKLIQNEIAFRGDFASSLVPLAARDGAPAIVSGMYGAGRRASVGPMAAVAGAVAEFVGRALLALTDEVIVENGGDIYLVTCRPRVVSVYAGRSALSHRLGVEIQAGSALGICTSSGTVGHSHSEGQADAAMVIADDTAFADAAATALGNRVRNAEDIEAGIAWARSLDGVRQTLIISDGALGVWGEFTVRPVKQAGQG